MDPQAVKALIEAGMPEARVEVRGEDRTHFDAIIVSEAFAGKRTLQRHQMVYQTLGEKMGREIHALSMQTLTPEEADSAS